MLPEGRAGFYMEFSARLNQALAEQRKQNAWCHYKACSENVTWRSRWFLHGIFSTSQPCLRCTAEAEYMMPL